MPALILWGQHDRVSKGGRKRVRRRKGIEEEGRREQVGRGREEGREGGKLGWSERMYIKEKVPRGI